MPRFRSFAPISSENEAGDAKPSDDFDPGNADLNTYMIISIIAICIVALVGSIISFGFKAHYRHKYGGAEGDKVTAMQLGSSFLSGALAGGNRQ